jgi:hypothetical protein
MLFYTDTSSIAPMVPGTILLPIGLLITGWTVQNKVFWLVPDIVSDGSDLICVSDAE